MSAIAPDRLHPATLVSIEAQPSRSVMGVRLGVRRCGCEQNRDGWWWLCQYHQGYDDAAEALAPREGDES